MVLKIRCSGTPYQIGHQHGSQASTQVKGCLVFYEKFFIRQTSKQWPEVQAIAETFLPYLKTEWSDYVEEMTGLADGAGVDFLSILALNVRTEIGFGLIGDGCTAFAWKTDDASFIGQNWDWEVDQLHNIIEVHIERQDKPRIAMMTEAGIIGKIGLNSAGVGVTLNAIKAKGANVHKLPTHLALRTALDSWSQSDAKAALLKAGVAAACHITVADAHSGGVGLECSAADIVVLEMEDEMCTHGNHMLRPHAVEDLILLEDSFFRLPRVRTLLQSIGDAPTVNGLEIVLMDEENYPEAICRSSGSSSTLQTIFSIVMDLSGGIGHVKMGKPNEEGEKLELLP